MTPFFGFTIAPGTVCEEIGRHKYDDEKHHRREQRLTNYLHNIWRHDYRSVDNNDIYNRLV